MPTSYGEWVLMGSVLTIAGLFFTWCVYTMKHPEYLARLQEALKPGPYHTS